MPYIMLSILAGSENLALISQLVTPKTEADKYDRITVPTIINEMIQNKTILFLSTLNNFKER